MKAKALGLAIVGSGRIGTLRGRVAKGHPAVEYIAVSDKEPGKARDLAEKIGAQFHSGDNDEIISRPEVNAVIVSTAEGDHLAPILKALELGKPVLVEKPIGLTVDEADQVLRAIAKYDGNVRVGYSRRYMDKYLIAKEQMVQGRLGHVIGGSARVFNSRLNGMALMQRNPHATPVVDGLTYYVDLMNWLVQGKQLTEIYARGQDGVLKQAGYNSPDLTHAILTYDDGTIVNLSICYALPAEYPALGHAGRVEVIGTGGVIIINDDHTDQLMYSEKGVPHVYLPGHNVNMAFLQSGVPGDWALGEFWGPINNETRAWLEHISMGKPCALATPEEARFNLEATLAIQDSMKTGKPVALPLHGKTLKAA